MKSKINERTKQIDYSYLSNEELQNEEWRFYKKNKQNSNNYSNWEYYVSNLGRLKENGIIRTEFQVEPKGYIKACGRHLHRIVAEVFEIPNPNNYPQIMHINSNPLDNRVSNLQYGTQSMNNLNPITIKRMSESQKHRWEIMTDEEKEKNVNHLRKHIPWCKGLTKETNDILKIIAEKVSIYRSKKTTIKTLTGELTFKSRTEAAKYFGVSSSYICHCVKNNIVIKR